MTMTLTHRLIGTVALALAAQAAQAQLQYSFSAAPAGFDPIQFSFVVPDFLSAGDPVPVTPFAIGDGNQSWLIEQASTTTLATQGRCFLFATAEVGLPSGADVQCGLGVGAGQAGFWFFDGNTTLPQTLGTHSDWYVAVFADGSAASGGQDWAGVLTISAVPEPQSWALLLGGMAAVAGLARRRAAAA